VVGVLGPDDRAIETFGPFPTPAHAEAYAQLEELGRVQVVPHRPVAPADP
jgi:hypothetical protein